MSKIGFFYEEEKHNGESSEVMDKKSAVQDLDSEEEADDEPQEGMSSFYEE